MEWVEDHDKFITNEALEQQFGPLNEDPVDDVLEKTEQTDVALLALRDSESFDIVPGAAPSGLEVLRRLVRRWDLLSGGERRAILRQILAPDRCTLQVLPAGLEKWQQLMMKTSSQLHLKPSFQASWKASSHEPCMTDHVRAGLERNSGLH